MGVLEASYLETLLTRHGGNVSAAAKIAGVDRRTFHRLLNKHHIREPRRYGTEPPDSGREGVQARVA